MAEEKREGKGRTLLEIGVGRAPGLADMNLKSEDLYIAVDVDRFPRQHREFVEAFERRGVRLKFVKTDGLALPVHDETIDHVIVRNVLGERGFPNRSSLEWYRKQKIPLRQALEKLENELHRVTSPSGKVTVIEEWTPHVLWLKIPFVTKSRLDHIREVFGQRWNVQVEGRLFGAHKITLTKRG